MKSNRTFWEAALQDSVLRFGAMARGTRDTEQSVGRVTERGGGGQGTPCWKDKAGFSGKVLYTVGNSDVQVGRGYLDFYRCFDKVPWSQKGLIKTGEISNSNEHD